MAAALIALSAAGCGAHEKTYSAALTHRCLRGHGYSHSRLYTVRGEPVIQIHRPSLYISFARTISAAKNQASIGSTPAIREGNAVLSSDTMLPQYKPIVSCLRVDTH
jgi:hypothetical protein